MSRTAALLPALLLSLLAACGKSDNSAPAPASAPTPKVEAPAAPAATTTAQGDLDKGEKVFKSTCALCHASGAAGAPLFKSKEDWAPRIAQGKDTLYAHAIGGFTGSKGVMPPKGGNTALADADVKAAVDYMVSKAQ